MVFSLKDISDIKTANNFFDNYVKNFNFSVKEIELKYYHTYRVVDLAVEIAKTEKWSDNDIKLAYLIALFHDIGRFEQWDKYNTFWDSRSIDHAELGNKILKDFEILKNINEKEQQIIFDSIYYHNKYKIDDNLNSETLKFAKIVRDADKIDIMNVKLNYYKKEIKEKYLSDICYNSFLNKRGINYEEVKTDLDLFLLTISWWYELYFESSKHILTDKKYINLLLDVFPNNDKKEEIVNIVNTFKV